MNISTLVLSSAMAVSTAAANDSSLLMSYNLTSDASQYASLTRNTDFSIDIGGEIITRWNYNDESTPESSFSLPYARLSFSGNAEGWGFALTGEWSDFTESFEVLDAFVTTEFYGFDIRAGQFVTEFFSGYTVSPLDLATGEYSLIASNFGQGRSQGVQVARSFGDFRASASYTDGFENTGFSGVEETEYGLTARLDWNVLNGVRIGGAYSHQNTDSDYDTWTVDASVSYADFDILLAYVTSDVYGSFSDNFGVLGVVSYNLTETIQPFVQYEYGELNGTDLNILTVGVNKHFTRNVRLTTSVGYTFEEISEDINLGRSAWAFGNDDDFAVSAQLSFSF